MSAKRVDFKNKIACVDCVAQTTCRDSASSWLFLFIGLVATISIRLVNFVLGISALWAKTFWYTGVIGFFIFFLYKFRQDMRLKKNLQILDLERKLADQEPLSLDEYRFLSALLCALKLKKDTVNYFFIFFTSVLALAIGVYQDFLR